MPPPPPPPSFSRRVPHLICFDFLPFGINRSTIVLNAFCLSVFYLYTCFSFSLIAVTLVLSPRCSFVVLFSRCNNVVYHHLVVSLPVCGCFLSFAIIAIYLHSITTSVFPFILVGFLPFLRSCLCAPSRLCLSSFLCHRCDLLYRRPRSYLHAPQYARCLFRRVCFGRRGELIVSGDKRVWSRHTTQL